MAALYEEAARLKILGPHQHLAVFKGIHEHGSVFEYCEMGHLGDVIRGQPQMDNSTKLDISKQITRGLVHLHEHNFIHCDLNVNNVFVASGMVAKIGEIQGQLYNADGTIQMPMLSQEHMKSRHPQAGADEFSVRADIFALGTLLYHLFYSYPPLLDLDESQDEQAIRERFRHGEVEIDAKTASGMDRIIVKCWNSSFNQAIDILAEMDSLETIAHI